MVDRKRIGLVFSYNENWVAGAYYILNIIQALNTVDEGVKPKIVLLTDSLSNFNLVKEETKYPFLSYCSFPIKAKYSFIDRVINKLFLKLIKKKVIKKKPFYPKLDFLYPYELKGFNNELKKVNWIPDFQEEYLPQFFSKEEIKSRKEHQKEIVSKGDIVVFSSKDAKKDFVKLYPDSCAQLFVLSFAVTHPDFSKENIDNLRVKFKLPQEYFFAPNQFWAHKNHIVILRAVKNLKDNGVDICIAMSGKENDYRNKDNFSYLKNYIEKNNLSKNIKFLGFLPRTEQLCLFENAKAIIQPSLFEGWSTVVEDAKALNKFLILSDLKVHREQVKENVLFFDPEKSNELAELLNDVNGSSIVIEAIDYNEDVKSFGNQFIQLINS